jgi:hypothetical protein
VSDLTDAIRFIRQTKAQRPGADKAALQHAYVQRFQPEQRRSLFIGKGYSLRFSETQGASFSNTVLSLSALHSVDDRPVVICVVSPNSTRFLLANSTFLAKISHSSHHLRIDNVKGSFNGTDILTTYEGIENKPETFEQLFAIHSAFTWAENLERLVEATTAIVARNQRFAPTSVQRDVIRAAPERAAAALSSPRFVAIENELRSIVRREENQILNAAALENVNLRGNRIERVVTGGENQHDLGDLRRALEQGELGVDIKTKLADRTSAPKAYNIDKMLAFLAEPGSVFAFLVIEVSVHARTVDARLVPVLDEVLLAATGIQHHWAGRGSRGVTQLSGQFGRVLDRSYNPSIDTAKARAFLDELLKR